MLDAEQKQRLIKRGFVSINKVISDQRVLQIVWKMIFSAVDSNREVYDSKLNSPRDVFAIISNFLLMSRFFECMYVFVDTTTCGSFLVVVGRRTKWG